jgi:hypothetical protein
MLKTAVKHKNQGWKPPHKGYRKPTKNQAGLKSLMPRCNK